MLELGGGWGRVVGRGLDKFCGDGTNRVNNWSKLHQPYGSFIMVIICLMRSSLSCLARNQAFKEE